MYVCLFVHTVIGKQLWGINTKLGTRILYSSRSACIDPEVKRSKVKITWLHKPSRHTVASDYSRQPTSRNPVLCSLHQFACQYDCLCLGRLFDRVDLIKPVSIVRPPVHTSTKNFFDFNEIWHVGRGLWVMHDGMQYDLIKVKVTSPSKLEIRPFSQVISSAIYNGSWQLTTHS